MKKVILGALILLCASCGLEEEPFYVSKVGEELTIKSKFGINRFLLRKINLGGESTSSSNNVVNFGGARIVSAFSDFDFYRGYVVSNEVDDVAPVKFNDTYIGGNHGAAVGVELQTVDQESVQIGSLWEDETGARFLVSSFEAGRLVVVSDPESVPGGWRFQSRVDGSELRSRDGEPSIRFTSQRQVQVFPSVERISVSVDAGEGVVLDSRYRPVQHLLITETYNLINPAIALRGCDGEDRCKPTAQVTIRYTIRANQTDIATRVEALQDLNGFSAFGVQAAPLNFSGARLLQYVRGSQDFEDWTDITDITQGTRISTEEGLPTMAQRVERDTLRFGQSIGYLQAPQINGEKIRPVGEVEVSSSRKQYAIALEPGRAGFDGQLNAGDVVEVWAFKRYWPGERDGEICFELFGYGRCI